jgi:DNA-binding XRE family transcriptional regulator
MHSKVFDSLPLAVRRSLSKLGRDLALARRKRSVTSALMAERIGVSKGTYLRAEKGDPTVSMGVYAMAFFVLGFGEPLGDLIDARRDDRGLLLDAERVPKRVRARKTPKPL